MTTFVCGVIALLALRFGLSIAADVMSARAAFERALDGCDERPSNVITFSPGGRSAWRRKR